MRIAFLLLLLPVAAAEAQATHYQVKLTPDRDMKALFDEEVYH